MDLVLIGGSGFLGSEITRQALAAGVAVTVIDRVAPQVDDERLRWIEADVCVDDLELPAGRVVVLLPSSDTRPRWPWVTVLDGAVGTARLARLLAGRDVILLSSAEVYGLAAAPLTVATEAVLPMSLAELDDWCLQVMTVAALACPPHRSAALCRQVVDADPSGRWVYTLTKLAQERILSMTACRSLTVLRLANTYGIGQERVVVQMLRAALGGKSIGYAPDTVRTFVAASDVAELVVAGCAPGMYNVATDTFSMEDLAHLVADSTESSSPFQALTKAANDSCGVVTPSMTLPTNLDAWEVGAMAARLRVEVDQPLFHPPIGVVVPPRPVRPDEVAARQQECLWSGRVKNGNRWSNEALDVLRKELWLDDDAGLVLTTSGTAALRLVIGAIAGRAEPGELAVLPAFTFPATAEVLVQLGYQLRFVDVDPRSWTLDIGEVEACLAHERVGVVVGVDTFGNPCDYDRLAPLCAGAGVPLIADSAAAIGSRYRGRPVAGQALGHAYSMSFAKVLSAGGAGGAALLPAHCSLPWESGWDRSGLMNELHAIVALDQLRVLDELVERRQAVAEVYQRAAVRLGLETQRVASGDSHCWVHFVMLIPAAIGRERVGQRLASLGVGTKPYFEDLARVGYPVASGQGALFTTQRLDCEALALPMSSEITVSEAERVITALEKSL